jgi:hypothetical protein
VLDGFHFLLPKKNDILVFEIFTVQWHCSVVKAIQHLDLYENWCLQDGKQANPVTLCPVKDFFLPKKNDILVFWDFHCSMTLQCCSYLISFFEIEKHFLHGLLKTLLIWTSEVPQRSVLPKQHTLTGQSVWICYTYSMWLVCFTSKCSMKECMYT